MEETDALPALSWTLSHVFPSDGRDLPSLSFLCLPVWGTGQQHQVLKQGPHPPTLGDQGWQSWDCTDTHTHTHTRSLERMEPLTMLHPLKRAQGIAVCQQWKYSA